MLAAELLYCPANQVPQLLCPCPCPPQPFKMGDRVAVSFTAPGAPGAFTSNWFEGVCEKIDLRWVACTLLLLLLATATCPVVCRHLAAGRCWCHWRHPQRPGGAVDLAPAAAHPVCGGPARWCVPTRNGTCTSSTPHLPLVLLVCRYTMIRQGSRRLMVPNQAFLTCVGCLQLPGVEQAPLAAAAGCPGGASGGCCHGLCFRAMWSRGGLGRGRLQWTQAFASVATCAPSPAPLTCADPHVARRREFMILDDVPAHSAPSGAMGHGSYTAAPAYVPSPEEGEDGGEGLGSDHHEGLGSHDWAEQMMQRPPYHHEVLDAAHQANGAAAFYTQQPPQQEQGSVPGGGVLPGQQHPPQQQRPARRANGRAAGPAGQPQPEVPLAAWQPRPSGYDGRSVPGYKTGPYYGFYPGPPAPGHYGYGGYGPPYPSPQQLADGKGRQHPLGPPNGMRPL